MADSRKAAEQAYTVTAFDYPSAPIGSRDWCLFWEGWQACMKFSRLDRAQLRSDLNAARYEINRLHLLRTGSLSDKERDEWKAKAEANERDAERYRDIRAQACSSFGHSTYPYKCTIRLPRGYDSLVTFDVAIDAARSAEKEKE